MELFEEEKAVYLTQRQSLWDKGAPPPDFILVDSLLVGINTQINEQSNKAKILSRKVADIEDQVKTIDQQRTSLSTNIRNNYTAERIFEEFSTEEKERLEKQLVTTQEQIGLAMAEQEDLNAQISAQTGDKNYFQLKHDRIKGQELAEETKLKQKTLAEQELEILKDKRSRRITYAIIGIGIVAFVLFMLYYVGKKRKSRKINN